MPSKGLPPLLLFLTALIVAFYAIGASKWWHQGIAFIQGVGIDVLLSVLFVAIGNFIEALVAAFGGPQLHRQGVLTLVYILFGFLVLEFIKQKRAPTR